MTNITTAGTYALGDHTVKRMGYGAMQLAGPGVFGPPKDHATAVAVLREAIESGVDHIDTSDFYGPYVVNKLIKEALHPYPDDLVIVTKLGATRGDDASWNPAQKPEAHLERGVHDATCAIWASDALDVVNMRIMGTGHGPSEASIEPQFTALAKLQQQGLIRHLGLSNVTSTQVAQARRIAPVVCVQNMYNVANQGDDALIDELAGAGIAYVPFFPLGGFSAASVGGAVGGRARPRSHAHAGVALAWLLHRVAQHPADSRDVFPWPPARDTWPHLELKLPDVALAKLDGIGKEGGASNLRLCDPPRLRATVGDAGPLGAE